MASVDVVLDIAARQGGVVTRRQALDAGLTERQVDRRVAAGRWQVEVAGVYRLLPAVDDTDFLRGAVIALPGALVGFGSAAHLLGLGRFSVERPVVVVRARTTHVFPNVCVRRATVLGPSDRAIAGGLPVTSVPRTVIDLAADLPDVAWRSFVDDLLVEGRVSIGGLAVVADRVCGKGRPGSRVVREFLRDRATGQAHSRLEREGLAILEAFDIGGYEVEYPMPWDPARRFDVAFPAERVAVEWDSRRWHTARERMGEDRRRDREALVHGWVTIRFTADDLAHGPMVARDVAATLEGRRSSG